MFQAGAISCDSLSEPDISPGSDLLDALSLSSSAQLSEQMQQTQRASLKPHTLQVPYIVRACCKHIETYGKFIGILRGGGGGRGQWGLAPPPNWLRCSELEIIDEQI